MSRSVDGYKRCVGCEKIKPDSDFSRDCRTYDDLKSRCLVCTALGQRRYKKRRHELGLDDNPRSVEPQDCVYCRRLLPATNFSSNKRCGSGLMFRCKDCESEKREVYRVKKRDSQYGFKSGEHDRMIVEQGGVCAICGKSETARDHRSGVLRNLAVDHDHESGMVRGLLCGRCNPLLGYAHDDPDLLDLAASYLRKAKGLRFDKQRTESA